MENENEGKRCTKVIRHGWAKEEEIQWIMVSKVEWLQQ